jgi:hypothetical protein
MRLELRSGRDANDFYSTLICLPQNIHKMRVRYVRPAASFARQYRTKVEWRKKARVWGRVSLSGGGPWNCLEIFQDMRAHARSLNARNAGSASIFLNGRNVSMDAECGTCGNAMPAALHSRRQSASRRHNQDPKGANLYIPPARRGMAILFDQRKDAYRRLQERSMP